MCQPDRQASFYRALSSQPAQHLAERAHAAGVAVTLEVWTAMWHVWQMGFGLMPESDRDIARIGEFLRVCFAD